MLASGRARRDLVMWLLAVASGVLTFALWAEAPDGSFAREMAGLTDGWWELRAAVETADATWLVVPEGLWRLDGSGPRRLYRRRSCRAMVRSNCWAVTSRWQQSM